MHFLLPMIQKYVNPIFMFTYFETLKRLSKTCCLKGKQYILKYQNENLKFNFSHIYANLPKII